MKVDEKFCAAFNTVRSNNVGKKFKREELAELLVNSIPGFSKQSSVITFLVKNQVILKEGGKRSTLYTFTSTPVHIATLSKVIFSLKEYNNTVNKKYRESCKSSKEVAVEEQPIVATPKFKHLDEGYCINFLKSRGYKIMKQVVNFEEV